MKESNSQKASAGFKSATGTSGEGYSRGTDKYAKNQYTGHSNDGRLVNKGRGPTVGNTGCESEGPMRPMAAKVPALPAQGSIRDNINRGSQVRTPGGTRAFDPSATQNYKGNADSINVGRGPTKGNQQ